MKKKITSLFVFLLLMIGISNVNAEEKIGIKKVGEGENFIVKYNDEYQFTIKGFFLNVYEINEETKVEDTEKFFNEQPTKTINIPIEDIVIAPTYKEDTVFGNPALYINLNYNLTKEKLKSYLQEQINSVTDEKTYSVDIMLNYSLDSYPSEYTKLYRYQLFRSLVNSLENVFGDENANPYIDMEINQTNDITQLLNSCLIEKKNDEVVFTYYDTAEQLAEKNSLGQAINFLIASKQELKSGDSSFDKVVLFHNLKDEEFFINSIKEQNAEENMDTPSNENFSINPKTDISDQKNQDVAQKVKVDNTSANKSSIIIFFSIFMIVIGVIVIISTISIKNSRIYNN